MDETTQNNDVQGQEPETVNDNTQPTPAQDSDDKTFSAEYVQELRQENAKWRTKLRELEQAETQRQEQKLVEKEEWKTLAETRAQELEKLQAQIREQNIQSLKMETIQQLGLPSDAIDFLTGDNADDIKAQAEKFKSLMPNESEAGSQEPRQKQQPRMTMIPGGEAPDETREQKMKRIYGHGNILG